MNFDLIFDNGGGITLQTENYCHYYDSPKNAATDVADMLEPGAMPECWEGNEPNQRMSYDAETERNGGYHWVSDNDILETVGQMAKEDREDWLDNINGLAETQFFEHLFEIRDKRYLQQ